jgi:hypothetical protein
MVLKSRLRNLILLFALLPLAACLFRTRVEVRQVSTAPLQEATREQLVDFVNTNAASLQTLVADVDYDVTVSKQKKPKSNEYKVTEITEFSGILLVKKPDLLRLRGLAPAFRTTMFDMVGGAKAFSVSIPPKNEFVVGSNEVVKPSDNVVENVRPQAIWDALPLEEINPQKDLAFLVQGTEMVKDPKTHKQVQQADYELYVTRKDGDNPHLWRKIIFSRVDLLPDRLIVYNPQGEVATDTAYEDYKDYDGVRFPTIFHIRRPIEGLDIQLSITKLTVNQPLKDEQFTLTQPPGSRLINLDQKSGSTAEVNAPAQEAPKPMR